jgi:hypothetical protein
VTNDGTSPARKESRKCNRCKTPPHQSPPARSHLPTQISPKVGGALGILLASTLAPPPPPLPPLRPPPPLRVHTPRHLTICCLKIKSTDKSSISQSLAHTNVLKKKKMETSEPFSFSFDSPGHQRMGACRLRRSSLSTNVRFSSTNDRCPVMSKKYHCRSVISVKVIIVKSYNCQSFKRLSLSTGNNYRKSQKETIVKKSSLSRSNHCQKVIIVKK